MERPESTADRNSVAGTETPVSGADLYLSDELVQKTNLLLHLTENSDRLVLVKGEDSSGKTTFLNHFISLAPESWLIFRIDADPMIQPDQLLGQLIEHFGKQTEGDLLDGLIQRFEYLRATGRTPVIVVDDANQLPIASVITLLRLVERSRQEIPLVKVLLFATPDVESYLSAPQIQAMDLQLIQAVEMPVLSRTATEAFADHMFERAGVKRTLSASEVDKLCREAKGNIGGISSQLEQMVLDESGSALLSPSRPGNPMKLSGGKLVAMLALVSVIPALFLFQGQIRALFGSAGETSSAEAISEDAPVVSEQKAVEELTAPGESSEPFKSAPAEETVPIALPEIAQTSDFARQTGTGSRDENQEPIDVQSQQGVELIPPESISDEAPGEPEVVASSIASAPAANEEQLSQTSEGAEQTGVSRSVEKAIALESPASEPVQVEPNPPQPSEPTQSDEQQYLRAQNPTFFTLQLIAVGDENGAKKYIAQNGLTDNGHYFLTQSKGKSWYAVVYGVYPDRESAVTARGEISNRLNNKGIWPRSFASVHAAMQ